MRLVLASLVFFFFFFFLRMATVAAAAADAANSSCPLDCNNQGKCSTFGNVTMCMCLPGFYGSDCSITVANAYPSLWISYRVFMILLFLPCVTLSMYTFFCLRRFTKKQQQMHFFSVFFNAREWVLILVFALSFVSLLYYCLDPASSFGWMPVLPNILLFGITFPLIGLLYSLLLFHMLGLLRTTIRAIYVANQTAQINKHYKSENLTLEGILSRVGIFRRRMRIGFAVLNTLAFTLELARDFYFGIEFDGSSWLTILWAFGFIFYFGSTLVGTIVVGQRLIKLMPVNLLLIMKPMFLKMYAQGLVFVIAFFVTTVGFLFAGAHPLLYMLWDFLWRCALAVVCYLMLSVFIHISLRFPFVGFGWDEHPEFYKNNSNNSNNNEFPSRTTRSVSLETVNTQQQQQQQPSQSTSTVNIV